MIGIVTQPLGYNYGGILQNFALQKVLYKLGFESITIDDSYRYSKVRYLISCIFSFCLRIIGRRRSCPPKPYRGRSIPNITGKFMFENIRISSPCEGFTIKTLEKYSIDKVIVGSDQVWRPSYNKSIYNMYLDFVPSKCKKIAYAASFGTDKWEYNEEETIKCKHLLESFSTVSVREKSGIELIKRHFDYPNVKFVLDPTLLLYKDDYLSLCRRIPKCQSKYLCAYILDLSNEKLSLIHDMARRMGLDLKIFSAHDNIVLSVEEWLCNFRDASFVVTDSFHGTVFSIIFECDFIVLPNDERGKDRFVSLLSVLGLSNRISYNSENREEPIQWDKVNDSLCFLRKDSMSYLRNNL